jgi:NADH-quinone oxidoreductase subunit G
LEPEDESPILFLRLRKAVRKGLKVFSVAPLASRGLDKLSGTLLTAAPGSEAAVLDALRRGDDDVREAAQALAADGAVILVGERLAGIPGALSAVAALADATSSGLEWVPRRAGERGAIEAGALPNLLPGGRPVADAAARVDVATAWGLDHVRAGEGRDSSAIVAGVHTGEVRALLVGGVDPNDLPDPLAALAAIDAAPFVVSLELRESAVTARADVVLPVAAAVEKAGTFVDWEGRYRPFDAVLRGTNAMPDVRVLHVLAEAMGVDLGLPDVATARREIEEVGLWDGDRPTFAPVAPSTPPSPAAGEAVLATWSQLLDAGRMQDGEPYLAGTARDVVARRAVATAAGLDVADGDRLTVATDAGEVTAPVVVTEMPDGVVWLPTNAAGKPVRSALGAGHGAVVRLAKAAAPVVQGGSS